MSDSDWILHPGQPPLSHRYGEKTTGFRFILPVSQLEHVKARASALDIPASEYLRRLIAQDMAKHAENDSPEE